MSSWLGRLIGIDDLRQAQDVHVRFAADWAQNHPAFVLFGCAALAAAAITFYLRWQKHAGRRARAALAVIRASLLVLLLLILAEPVISMSITHRPRSPLLMLIDGTDSMNMKDKIGAEERALLDKALPPAAPDGGDGVARIGLVHRALRQKNVGLLEDLNKRFDLSIFLLDSAEGHANLRQVRLAPGRSGDVDPEFVAGQVQAKGQLTAIGGGLEELARRYATHRLAGVIAIGDFDQNAGIPALAGAKALGAPVYAVGVGPREAADLVVELQPPPILKRAERIEVPIHLRQTGLTGRTAEVELFARRLGSAASQPVQDRAQRVGSRSVRLDGPRTGATITFEPELAGRYALEAKVRPFEEEVLAENNSATREVVVRDDSLKLLYVEYEPTWEWRFIKEVFHRDTLVGREGFRTYLHTADFDVRRTNELFLGTLTRPRAEFFAYDVIIVSDVPAHMLTAQFQEMVHEYVEKFGGGLVVLSGPRFGPCELRGTRIGDMLPVVPDSALKVRDGEFSLQLTPAARQYEFMQLGAGEEENQRAWANLGKLPWYQPVARPHPLATVLAVHPSHKCSDDKTPQPLIAARRFGKGEVIYVGFNETWRLRKKYGERYYRQLWGQMIYRLGLGRALGAQKRFLVQTDRKAYQPGERVGVSVEAWSREFEPLKEKSLAGRLIAQSGAASPVEVGIPLARDNVVYETSVLAPADGAYRLLVRDPVTGEEAEAAFTVASTTAERRSALRDHALQKSLADQTGGRAYEITQLADLLKDLRVPALEEREHKRIELWNTWLVLVLALGLMMSEWVVRKWRALR